MINKPDYGELVELDPTGGDFGLAIFNMMDDQSIDLDTGLKGAFISYSNDFAIFEYIYGNQRSWRSTIHMPDFDERIPNFRTNYILNG